ncbi:MAG: YbaK/EbsC family protein [Thermoleophilia bacterium]|nr:YbaK/EbsC family protein [Thermoleophilia bacterium]
MPGSSAWPDPVERVASFLRAAGAEARLEEFPEGTRTARDAARAVGCEERDIVKSLVFLCDGRPVVVLVPGDRLADAAKVAATAEAKRAAIAGAEEVERATGFGPGAVSPFALPPGIDVLVDRALLGRATVWAGAGSPRHVVGVAPAELVRLSRARPADAAEDG